MLKGFTHARLACGCRLAFRDGVEGSPVAVVVDEKGPTCALPLHVRDDRAGSGVMTSGRHWRSPAGLDSTPSTETTSPTTVAETRRLPTLSPSILAR